MVSEKITRAIKKERKVLLNEAESLAQMGSWKWTENKDELVWSEGLYKIFDKNPEEYVSWGTFLDNVFPEDTQLVVDFLHEVKTYRKGSSIDYRIVKNGEIRYLALTVKPHTVFNIDILGAVIDITDRKEYAKQLEQYNLSLEKVIKELDEKEKKYRILFERSIDPIFLATDELVLMDVNRSFLKFLEYPNTETESITMGSIFANAEDYFYFRNTIKEVQQIKDFEVSLITNTGEYKTCLLNCVFIPDQAAGLCCYQGIIHDLTQRKQTENDLLNAERLSLTGKIARTIAHEVRNPLTNLNLALDQLRGEIPPDNESAKFYSDVIERNANRIENLIDEMLNSSKPKQLHLALTSVREMINNTISQAIDRIKLKEIQLLFNCEKDLPRILIDNEQIQIALLNIIINAVEAMIPQKGVLKIGASRKDKILLVTISDNGKGIPIDAIGKLFDPFFTNKEGGKGLGLTATKNILNSHNARIEVKSELDKGTTFFIYFTLAE
jgi:PAS domain S-box-containing protein